MSSKTTGATDRDRERVNDNLKLCRTKFFQDYMYDIEKNATDAIAQWSSNFIRDVKC